MPPSFRDEGLRAALEAHCCVPGTLILVLSQYVEERDAGELLESGAEGIGYLLKERVADVGDFDAALRRVAGGGTLLDSEVVAQLIARRRRGDPLDTLTAREREALPRIAESRSQSAIADSFFVNEGTIEQHVTAIFGKLNLLVTDSDHHRVLAVLTYLQSRQSSVVSRQRRMRSRCAAAPSEASFFRTTYGYRLTTHLTATTPSINGTFGLSSGGTICLPGNSRMRSNSFAPLEYGYSRRVVIVRPAARRAVTISPTPH